MVQGRYTQPHRGDSHGEPRDLRALHRTPQGDVYGYASEMWDGMFPRVMSAEKLDYTIKGLRFCGGHGTNMDGYSQAYLSGAGARECTLKDMKEGR